MFLCIFLNTGFPDRPSSSTESIFLMQKCALLIARPWLQQLFWLVYFDSRSWLIFFWFVFGPHLWKCSQSSADWVLCWREVESCIDDNQKSLWDLLSSQIWRFCRVWSYKRRKISVASYYGEVFFYYLHSGASSDKNIRGRKKNTI